MNLTAPLPKHLVSKSKFLSLILRHKPEAAHLTLDQNGWVDVDVLLEGTRQAGSPISREELNEVVEKNEKKRFELDLAGNRIRARQGHSIEVDLQLKREIPRGVLYHGTAERNRTAILKEGLTRQNRHHVHLSPDPETARNVGSRHGKPLIFVVDAPTMHHQGNFAFFLSENGVWLTDHVPPQYLRIQE